MKEVAMNLVVNRGGSSLDHIALGVADTREGTRQIAKMTGVEPRIGPQPDPEQFYWSSILRLGSGRFLEILGPNPGWNGFHPMIETVRKFADPQPLFWYVATDDIDTFGEVAGSLSAPLEQRNTYHHSRDGITVSYTNAVIGPGFRGTRPNVIQWHQRADWMEGDAQVTLDKVSLTSPIAGELNALFGKLGIQQEVGNGPESMALTLGTPNGTVEFSAPGVVVDIIPPMRDAAAEG